MQNKSFWKKAEVEIQIVEKSKTNAFRKKHKWKFKSWKIQNKSFLKKAEVEI